LEWREQVTRRYKSLGGINASNRLVPLANGMNDEHGKPIPYITAFAVVLLPITFTLLLHDHVYLIRK
jgi:hypothetical protein